jgi:hypothetical protein
MQTEFNPNLSEQEKAKLLLKHYSEVPESSIEEKQKLEEYYNRNRKIAEKKERWSKFFGCSLLLFVLVGWPLSYIFLGDKTGMLGLIPQIITWIILIGTGVGFLFGIYEKVCKKDVYFVRQKVKLDDDQKGFMIVGFFMGFIVGSFLMLWIF